MSITVRSHKFRHNLKNYHIVVENCGEIVGDLVISVLDNNGNPVMFDNPEIAAMPHVRKYRVTVSDRLAMRDKPIDPVEDMMTIAESDVRSLMR